MRPTKPVNDVKDKSDPRNSRPGDLRHFRPFSPFQKENLATEHFIPLLEDYRDFLRLRGAEEWPKEHRYTRRLRQLNRQPNANYETFKKGIEHPDPLISANVMIGLIKLTNYLLDQQLRHLERAFVREGGLRERMTRTRLAQRANQLRQPP